MLEWIGDRRKIDHTLLDGHNYDPAFLAELNVLWNLVGSLLAAENLNE